MVKSREWDEEFIKVPKDNDSFGSVRTPGKDMMLDPMRTVAFNCSGNLRKKINQ